MAFFGKDKDIEENKEVLLGTNTTHPVSEPSKDETVSAAEKVVADWKEAQDNSGTKYKAPVMVMVEVKKKNDEGVLLNVKVKDKDGEDTNVNLTKPSYSQETKTMKTLSDLLTANQIIIRHKSALDENVFNDESFEEKWGKTLNDLKLGILTRGKEEVIAKASSKEKKLLNSIININKGIKKAQTRKSTANKSIRSIKAQLVKDIKNFDFEEWQLTKGK